MKSTQVYIAAPLFNAAQIAIIQRIEQLCESSGTSYFSPRLHSEPYLPKLQDRKNPAAWRGMFKMNVDAINDSGLIIAVVSYPLPEGQKMGVGIGIQEPFEHHIQMADFKPVELPDTGATWEMGYAYGSGRLILGFHPEKRGEHLNVMLTHGCDGVVSGWESLQKFLCGTSPYQNLPPSMFERSADAKPSNAFGHLVANYQNIRAAAMDFDWTACEQWAAQQGGGEA